MTWVTQLPGNGGKQVGFIKARALRFERFDRKIPRCRYDQSFKRRTSGKLTISHFHHVYRYRNK